jgi:hypothetical protein
MIRIGCMYLICHIWFSVADKIRKISSFGWYRLLRSGLQRWWVDSCSPKTGSNGIDGLNHWTLWLLGLFKRHSRVRVYFDLKNNYLVCRERVKTLVRRNISSRCLFPLNPSENAENRILTAKFAYKKWLAIILPMAASCWYLNLFWLGSKCSSLFPDQVL